MKKFLLTLFIGLFFLVGFSYGEKTAVCEIVDVKTVEAPVKNTRNTKSVKLNYDYSYKVGYFNMVGISSNWTYTNTGGAMCFASESVSNIYSYSIFFNGVQVGDEVGTWNTKWEFICYEGVGNWEVVNNTSNTNLRLIVLNDMTKNQCESFYDLVDSSLYDTCQSDLGTCQSDLDDCQSQSSECTGSINPGESNWSALYINDIQHQSAPLINIDIPDYIYWDYSSTEDQFDLYVGSGYDQDYIDGVLSINSYKPDSGDFTNIFVSGLTLIFPYIFIVLLILFIWKLLKRIFK